MKRTPAFSLLLAVAILGGLFLLFPVWVGLLATLALLVSVQVALVRRSLYRLPPGSGRSVGVEPAFATDPPASEADAAPSSDAPQSADAPADAGAGPVLDEQWFSRFREHLETAERGTPATATKAPGSDEDADVADRVTLSSAARRGTGPEPRKPAAAPPPRRIPPEVRPPPQAPEPAEEEGEDLFADLRPTPVAPARDAASPAETAPAAATAGEAPAAPADEADTTAAPDEPGEPTAPEPPPQPPEAAAAATEDEADPSAGLADEAAMLLRLARDAVAREDWEGARAGLQNYVAHLEGHPALVDWEAHRLQVRLHVHDGDANRALQAFEAMLTGGYVPRRGEVEPEVEALLEGAESPAVDTLRVSMLVRTLAMFRQAKDRAAMDEVYGLIEQAQEAVGDERKLLQYLKNHLEIRKVMGDLPGQLELIDQIGNRCYKLGLTEDAKHYYELGLRLRAEADPDTEQTTSGRRDPSSAVN